MKKNHNWDAVMNSLNESSTGRVATKMGSANSAGVTRCRLLEQWDHVAVRQAGVFLYISLTHP